MSQHHIIGRERAGPHVIIRHLQQPRRRTFLTVVLEAIGGITVLLLMSAMFWSGIA